MDCTQAGALSDRNPLAPPALPVKQRRSHSSSLSSVSDLQLEEGAFIPPGNCSTSPLPDVFVPPTDCHAAQCPIHRYGPSGHHERFFSDETPPPIPKKRLARTLSLPAGSRCNLSQRHVSPPRRLTHEDKDSTFHHAGESETEDASENLHLNQFDLETHDQHLLDSFGSLCQQEQVYASIENCYMRFMRSSVRHLEATVLLDQQEVEMVRTLQPEEYLLCGEDQPKKILQECFFSVNVSKVPTLFLSGKVNRKGSVLMHSKPLPHHPNTEEIIAHFPPCMAQLSESPALELPQGGSTEPCQQSDSITKRSTVCSFLERGFTVTIVRDFPWGTLEDFVREGVLLHRSRPDLYERRLCLLLLQLVHGLQHLSVHDVKHFKLEPRRVMLVWWHTKKKGPAQKTGATAEPGGVMRRDCFPRHSETDKSEDLDEALYENVKEVQALWETWGTPRVVISRDSAPAEFCQPSVELQLGCLVKHCLLQHGDTHHSTLYAPGLRHLIQQLTSKPSGVQLADTAGVLQALLWGPRAGLFEKIQMNAVTVRNWLMVKRSLLVLKLAEKGLFLNGCGLDWEDYLCLQYLSSADPQAVLGTAIQMGFHNSVKTTGMATTNTEM